MEDRLHLRPTPEQYRAFGDYLCEAHSWYKHLLLMSGRRFVVFVAPDAGIGRLVARIHGASLETMTGYKLETPPEGPEFTDDHPRLHYGWKTTKEYRTRFGYLDYMCRRGPIEPYGRDAGPPVELPNQIEERCGFVLYPYISGMFAEAVTWSVHEEALKQLRAGVAHPAREMVLELARLAEAQRTSWSTLSESDRNWVFSREMADEKPMPGEGSIELREYFDLSNSIQEISRSLQAQEADKIRRALAELDACLLHGE